MPEKTISSAGIGALEGQDIDENMASLLVANGYSASPHVARKLDGQLVANADIVLVMEEEHQNMLMKQYPQASGKILLLGKWRGDTNIYDPYRRSNEVFGHVFDQINDSCLGWCEKLGNHP